METHQAENAMGTKYSGDRIRGRALQEIRKQHFARFPLCAECQKHGRITLATELDHIIALANGGKDFDEDAGTNRQGLCSECHEAKTQRDMGYRERHAIGSDGWPIGYKKGGEGVS
jgi:5-methylcytosine-specific restriction protein A